MGSNRSNKVLFAGENTCLFSWDFGDQPFEVSIGHAKIRYPAPVGGKPYDVELRYTDLKVGSFKVRNDFVSLSKLLALIKASDRKMEKNNSALLGCIHLTSPSEKVGLLSIYQDKCKFFGKGMTFVFFPDAITLIASSAYRVFLTTLDAAPLQSALIKGMNWMSPEVKIFDARH